MLKHLNNFTIGLGGKLTKQFSFTVDYYNITVEDRIVLGSEVTPPAGNPAFEVFLIIRFKFLC